MPLLTTCAIEEGELDTSGWSMRERVEYAASLFLLYVQFHTTTQDLKSANDFAISENRERILGPGAFSVVPSQETIHCRLLLVAFDQLAGIYKTRVQELLRVKERIDHLRRSAQALKAYKSRRLARLAMDHMLRDVFAELRVKEAEERGMLQSVFEVAAEIVQLGRAK